jgi:hypothetical protein
VTGIIELDAAAPNIYVVGSRAHALVGVSSSLAKPKHLLDGLFVYVLQEMMIPKGQEAFSTHEMLADTNRIR